MKRRLVAANVSISKIPTALCEQELEKASSRYHLIACWVAIIFDPVFVFPDYFNIPQDWKLSLMIRLSVSCIVLATVLLRKKLRLSTYFVASVPFTLISLQNAFTFSLIGEESLLGHNLNYMALFIGASMFVLWRWTYSALLILLSIITTIWFVLHNPSIDLNAFVINGGILLAATAIFMAVLIQTRYNLTVKEIKARLALQSSNEEIQAQAEEIHAMNERLEELVRNRTIELERKNKALEEYAFINAHKLRSPLASILGLVSLLHKAEVNEESRFIIKHLNESAEKLDDIVGSITQAIERGDIETLTDKIEVTSTADSSSLKA